MKQRRIIALLAMVIVLVLSIGMMVACNEECEHAYDNACDTDCNLCGETRTTTHTFANVWTPGETTHFYACTVCGAKKDEANHVYDEGCDADCNVCGAERTVDAAHTFDNPCDPDCNLCGEVREIAHDYKPAFDNDNHFDKCTKCDDIKNSEAHAFADVLTAAADTHFYACACGAKKDEEAHEYVLIAGEDTHYELCEACGDIINEEDHYDAAYDGACDVCEGEVAIPDWATILNGVVAPTLVPDADPDPSGDFSMPTYGGNTYTINDYMGAGPTNWNPHVWETNADSIFQSYAEMGFVEPIYVSDTEWKWNFEMAKNIQDVTALYALDDALRLKWGLVSGQGENVSVTTENKVYRFYLNEKATWADGTPITADTYIYSMMRLLDPKMQNYRANTYYNGSTALKNAALYFASESPIYDKAINEPADKEGPYYIHLDKVAFDAWTSNGYSLNYLNTNYGYGDAAAIATLSEYANPYGFIELNDDTWAAAKAAVKGFFFGFYNTEEEMIADGLCDANGVVVDDYVLYYFGFYNTGRLTDPYSFENVGIVKVDDYTFDYILEDTETMFYFLTGMTSNWIVYEELYEDGRTQIGDLWATNYGTSVETYMSYGPYMLTSYEVDKQIKMERNPAWYGWTDGRHVGQYQMTNLNIEIISDEATIENMFLTGQLDSLGLNAKQLSEYRNSSYLLKTDATYTYRFVFATDLAKLTALEAERNNGKNLKILSYDDFRKAISLSIDRAAATAQGTGGYKPAYALFNSLYYYDVENDPNSQYRNTDAAKQVIVDLYDITYGPDQTYKTLDEAYEAVTGFDLAQAKALFQAVAEEAIADGNYTAGQEIEIWCMATGYATLSEDDSAQERLINAMVSEAVKGTILEGKIKFIFQAGAADRYGDVASGKQEMIRGAWGGAAFYPFSTIRCYTEPDYMGGLSAIHESCGWNPGVETLTLTYDFDGDGSEEEVTHTLQDWAKLINGTEVGTQKPFTDPETMMFIFAKLEGAVLASYQCIPLWSETSCSLFSQKIKYATLNYNIMYGYGGTRFMTFNYTDAEWAAYVAEEGTLEY